MTGGCYLVADAAAAGLLPGLPQRAHDVVQVALGVVRAHPHHATSHALKIFYSIKNILIEKSSSNSASSLRGKNIDTAEQQ